MPPLFHRAAPTDGQADRIRAFWVWWDGVRPRVQAAIDSKDLAPLVDEISTRVKAVHAGLAWEIGPGLVAQHQLCVTGEGDIERRAVAERWWRAAPAPDQEWEFHPARQAEPPGSGYTLQIGGITIDPADLRFSISVDENRERLDVTVWHPSFATIEEATRTKIAFLILDGQLGADGVERWLGRVGSASAAPANESLDREALRARVGSLADTATGDRFVLAKATGKNGAPLILALNTALKHIDHLDKPVRLRVVVRLTDPDANGFPAADEADALNSYEDQLSGAISNAIFAGRVTGAGSRILNWFVSDSGDASSAINAVGKSRPWRVEVKAESDPRWESLKRNLLD